MFDIEEAKRIFQYNNKHFFFVLLDLKTFDCMLMYIFNRREREEEEEKKTKRNIKKMIFILFLFFFLVNVKNYFH
jgi:hypothetical protein